MADYEHFGGETYRIEIRTLPADVPPTVRVRQFLKAALRAYRLRATSITETTPYPAEETGLVDEQLAAKR
jgi:hypothetical protein